MIRNKKILLGVTGGIAAYKCAILVRLLVKEGAQVKVVMTKAAMDFVTPQTLSVLSKNEVTIDFFDSDHNWNNHVHLAEWADLFVIAPLTANTLAKMCSGQCDNVLLAVYFSSRCPLMVAPAMDLEMYRHATVKDNLKSLGEKGISILPAAVGELASGLEGEGRMMEPEEIVQHVSRHFLAKLPFSGKRVLINAGPTHEPIDPVRFIGNNSSGKMGVAIAEGFSEAGATVVLVMGPGSARTANTGIKVKNVTTAAEMKREMLDEFENSDIVICSAAVADYRPAKTSGTKIKKEDTALNLELVPTDDILAELGKRKRHQLLVGFALETENLAVNAKKKLKNKNLDLIVVNAATGPNAAIGGDKTQVSIIDAHNKISKFEFKSKTDTAKDIIHYILQFNHQPTINA